MIKNFKHLVYALTLLSQPFFWGICSMLNYDYEGVSSGSIFVVYLLSLFFLTILFIGIDLMNRSVKFNKLILVVPLFFTICYFIDNMLSGGEIAEWTKKSYLFFMLFGVSGSLIGATLPFSSVGLLYKYVDLITFIIGIGFIRSIPKMMLVGGMIDGYQDISYLSALSFCFILYGFLSNNQNRLFFFKNYAIRLISILVGIANIVSVLASGGRGGAVLLIIGSLVICFTFVEKKNMMKVIFFHIPVLIVLLLFGARLIGSSALSSILSNGMERAFSYIDSGGIDMSQTSNRDLTYGEAWARIKAEPLYGSGIFRTIGEYGYPHNIFIEMWESAGLLYLIFWIFIFKKSFINYSSLVKDNKDFYSLLPLFLYPSIFLLFSGSYLMTCTFWFTITFLLSYKSKI